MSWRGMISANQSSEIAIVQKVADLIQNYVLVAKSAIFFCRFSENSNFTLSLQTTWKHPYSENPNKNSVEISILVGDFPKINNSSDWNNSVGSEWQLLI